MYRPLFDPEVEELAKRLEALVASERSAVKHFALTRVLYDSLRRIQPTDDDRFAVTAAIVFLLEGLMNEDAPGQILLLESVLEVTREKAQANPRGMLS